MAGILPNCIQVFPGLVLVIIDHQCYFCLSPHILLATPYIKMRSTSNHYQTPNGTGRPIQGSAIYDTINFSISTTSIPTLQNLIQHYRLQGIFHSSNGEHLLLFFSLYNYLAIHDPLELLQPKAMHRKQKVQSPQEKVSYIYRLSKIIDPFPLAEAYNPSNFNQ